jgi:site-specific DNA-methyltransferase (adenine-specific)
LSIIHGDCVTVMAGMEPESVDAIVCDPPYDLGEPRSGASGYAPRTEEQKARRGFMGKQWDGTGIAFRRETWEAAYRVARPSAYLLAFGGTRTVHRMTVALEDAGWIIRDMLVWGYASGFPKSKASLKPAWEPIVMARKPGPLRMLAIDECRIPTDGRPERLQVRHHARRETPEATFDQTRGKSGMSTGETTTLGRWPANVVLTDAIFDGGVEGVVGGGETHARGNVTPTKRQQSNGAWAANGAAFGIGPDGPIDPGDSGTYSRFFLIPKSARSDREPVLGGLPVAEAAAYDHRPSGDHAARLNRVRPPVQRANSHPTVKPTDLMRHLVRLVTPTGGTVLDPFLGSGTTGLAAEMEGFAWIGIEREAEYVRIAEARLNGTQRGLGLDVPAPTPKAQPSLSDDELAKRAKTYPRAGFMPDFHDEKETA